MLIYETLIRDHERIKKAIDTLLLLADDATDDRIEALHRIRDSLIPHERSEEAVFYNSLKAVRPDHPLLGQSFDEHRDIEALLHSLLQTDPFDSDWRRRALALKREFAAHREQEETELFDLAKSCLTEEEALYLGRAFEKMRPRVLKTGLSSTTFRAVAEQMPPRFADSLEERNVHRI